MSNKDIDLMAHLMRRAGFGATKKRLNELKDQGYENSVEAVSYTHLTLPTNREV